MAAGAGLHHLTKTGLVLIETDAKAGAPLIVFPSVLMLVMQTALLPLLGVITSCFVLLVMWTVALLKMTRVAPQNSLSIDAPRNPWTASELVLGLMPAASTAPDVVQLQ